MSPLDRQENRAMKPTLVVGLGVSGLAVCELLRRQGRAVMATDLRKREQFLGLLDRLESQGCEFRLGEHRVEDFLHAEQIIVSPGVPLDIKPLVEAASRGIEIIGELEWAWRQVDLPTLAVTGTNGKTTTTFLVGEIFKAAGRRVFVGGNLGTPLSEWILSGETAELLVLEVSSFQLDTASTFRPQVGVVLNVTEDHLDRYESFEAYAASKFSLFSRQTETDFAIVNGDDPVCRRWVDSIPGRVLLYSRQDSRTAGRIDSGHLRASVPGRPTVDLDLNDCRLKGVHNEENILAAVLASLAMGAPVNAIEEVVRNCRGLPHRVEWIRHWRGIDFYDDSKGTNVGAVIKAVESFDRPVVLLLGGRDKLGSYEPLARLLKERGRGACVFGEAAPRITAALDGYLPTRSYSDLEAAFEGALEAAKPGDVILLSPACSSFDQYSGYKERGDHFQRLVARLPS